MPGSRSTVWLLPDILYRPFQNVDGDPSVNRVSKHKDGHSISSDYKKARTRHGSRKRLCAVNVYVPLAAFTDHQQQYIKQNGLRWRETSLDPPVSGCIIPISEQLRVCWYVHGGAWISGSRDMNNVHDICMSMAKANTIVVSVGYRLCRPQSTKLQLMLTSLVLLAIVGWLTTAPCDWGRRILWIELALLFLVVLFMYMFWSRLKPLRHPTQVLDIAKALRSTAPWLAHVGGNVSQSFMMGHSAGCHLTTTLYASPEYWVHTGLPRSYIRFMVLIAGVFSGNLLREERSGRFAGEIAFGPDEGQWNKYFAYELVRKHHEIVFPPTLLLSAWYDFGLRAHAELFTEALLSRGVDVQWHTIRDTNHFDITHFWRGGRHNLIRENVLRYIQNMSEV